MGGVVGGVPAGGAVASTPSIGASAGGTGTSVTGGVVIGGAGRVAVGSNDVAWTPLPDTGRRSTPVGDVGSAIGAAGASAKRPVLSRAIGAGRGSRSAACTRARPNSVAVDRVSGSGRPARSNTAASGPRSAETGISRSTLFDNVATVESPMNGSWPVTASSRHRHSEYTSLFGPAGTPVACSGDA